MPGFLTNDLPVLGQLSQNMRVPVDTEFPRGLNPASVAATGMQIAALWAEVASNTDAATPATRNTFGGVIGPLTPATAPGATLSVTLNNNLITAAYLAAGGVPEAGIYSGTNTGGSIPPGYMSAAMMLQSVTPAVGSVTWVWQNNGETALNGSMMVVWHL